MSHQALGPSLSQLRRKHLRRLAKLEELGRMHGELRRGRLPHARAVPGGTLHADTRWELVGSSELGAFCPAKWPWIAGKMAMDLMNHEMP